MKYKLSKTIVLLIMFIFGFMGAETVRAEKWCYYKDEKSMIRVSLKDAITEDDYGIFAAGSDFKAYIDVYNDNIQNISGNIKNYIKESRVEINLMGSGSLYIFTMPAYIKKPESVFLLSTICPEGILYLKSFGIYAYDNSQLEDLKSKTNNSYFDIRIFNSTRVDKDTYWQGFTEDYNIGGEIDELEGCEFIDQDVKDLINKILKYIAIIVPIAIIGISSYELAKAMGKGKEDEMKKAQKHMIIRIVVSLLIFLTPILVNLVFSVTETIWKESELYTCDINGNEINKTETEDDSTSACYYCGNTQGGKYYWGTYGTYGNQCTKISNYDHEECLKKNS